MTCQREANIMVDGTGNGFVASVMRLFLVCFVSLASGACFLDSTAPTRWCLNVGDTVGYVGFTDSAKIIQSCTFLVQKQKECFSTEQWTYTASDCKVGQKG